MGLSKEQKLEMVSKAIDAGFRVDLVFHRVATMEEVNSHLDIFEGLPVRFAGSKSSKSAWVTINDRIYDDKFEVTIFF